MRQQNIITMGQLRSDYEAIKDIGAPLLQCQGMLVPKDYPEMRFFFQSFPRPMPTNNDIADVAYAGGLQGHTAGVPKTSYQGSVTMLETENGICAAFAELVIANGGTIDCDYYDGRDDDYITKYELTDCCFTFEPADMSADGRSAVVTVSGSMQYMYFGQNAEIGQSLTSLIGKRSNGTKSLLDKVISGLKTAGKIGKLADQAKKLFG